MSTTLFGSMWAEFYGTSNLGAVRSIVVSATVLSTAAGPGATGLLIDGGTDLPRQMIGLAVYSMPASVGMIFCAIALRRRIRS